MIRPYALQGDGIDLGSHSLLPDFGDLLGFKVQASRAVGARDSRFSVLPSSN